MKRCLFGLVLLLFVPSLRADDPVVGAARRALAHSPHLKALERLVVWSRETPEQATILARAPAWPRLRNLHLIAALGQQTGWIDAVNVAAGRPLGSAFVFDEQPYPLAANFYGSWTPWISAGNPNRHGRRP
jgi:hypothetical protein